MYLDQSIFAKFNTHFFLKKRVSPQYWTTCVIFKMLPKVNNRPIGEHSPNLVTLLPT
jgi:hypothetical protein